MSKARPTAYIEEYKGELGVKVVLDGGSVIRARRDQQGRIQFDKPERVPRHIKYTIAPRLFAEIDERVFGFKASM